MINEQPEISEVELRAMTYNLLVDWYENEVYLGREKYIDGKKARAKQSVEVPEERIRDIDPLHQAKKDRPWLWNKKFKRKFMTYDHEGKEIELTETLSILDTFGPGPNETRRQMTSKAPDGRSFIRTEEFVSERENKRLKARVAYMKRIHQSMRHLDRFAPSYLIILRWYLGGMGIGAIGKKLGIASGKVEKYYECAITWIMGCIAEDPIWREYEPEFREVLKVHFKEEGSIDSETIWG